MNKETFLLSDRIKEIKSSFIKDGWVTIYENLHEDKNDESLIFCCLVSSKEIKSYRTNNEWEIVCGSEGKPTVWGNGKYQTFERKGIEPFLFFKRFCANDIEESYVDISEEFVLYFKLYETGQNKQNRKFYFINEVNDLDEVIRVEPNRIKVKVKYLKEYISVRKLYFSICFVFERFDSKTLKEIKLIKTDKNFHEDNYFYNHFIEPTCFGPNSSKIISKIYGKSIINYDKNKTKVYHFDGEKQQYLEFITGYNEDGSEKLEDCKQENKKWFTVTYFKKEVLDKYYNSPSKYKVDSHNVSSNFFSLKIDNNVDNYVPVFLIELGKIPYKEQLHWKQFNITPQNGISNTYRKTMIDGSWSEQPETPDLFFKFKYKEFNSNWEKKFGWRFYKSLAKEDEHSFTSLHIPTTNNVKSFKEQILSLVKVTIDRLNEKELSKDVEIEKGDKGINKLEKFLKLNNIELPDLISFLKNLWHLRSGLLAHSFSESNKECKRAIEYFGLRENNYVEVAKDIFIKSIITLNTLENRFL